MELPPSLRTRYRPLAVLGQGGFGAVWRCQDQELRREVAVKLLVLGNDPEAVARFEREARVTSQLRSPHVVEVYDHGVDDDVPWIAYALLDGVDLDAWVRREGPPSPQLISSWASQGCAALAVVHQAGLVHRDVKPANFLVRGDDRSLVLVDFGIARAEERAAETLHTEEGVILGTPGYMAPELFLGEPPSPASDQWAWAAVLAELVTGAPVYGTYQPQEVIAASRNFTPRSIRGIGPSLQRALDPAPRRRYPDMEALGRALEGADFRGPVPQPGDPALTTRSPGPGKKPAPPTRKLRPWRAPWIVAGTLACLGMGLWIGSDRGTKSPSGAAGPSPVISRPTETELLLAREDLEANEQAFRLLFTDGTQDEPWNWVPPWEVRPSWERERSRGAFLRSLAAPSWRGFLRAIVALLEHTERLPPEERPRWAPEVYERPVLAEVIREVLGRGISLAGDGAEVLVVGIMARGDTIGTKQALEDTRERFQVLLRSVDRLARRLEALPLESEEAHSFAAWASFASRRGDVAERLLELLRRGPARPAEMEWVTLRSAARALFRDPRFLRWENLRALDKSRSCSALPEALELLRPRFLALKSAEQLAEGSSYLWQIELEGRAMCAQTLRLPTAALASRLREYRDHIAAARREGWPVGDFLDRTADQIADAQRALVKRNDPAAEAAAKEFEALRELL